MTQLNKDRFIVECGCYNPEHLLIFEYSEDMDFKCHKSNSFFDEVYVAFTSPPKRSFFRRIIFALKYIFKEEDFLSNDTIIFNHDNVVQLKELANFLEERINKGLEKIIEDQK